MTTYDALQLVLYLAALSGLAIPLGLAIARVYRGERTQVLTSVLGPLERGIYRLSGIRPDEEMSAKGYTLAFLAFHAVGFVIVYALQRLQGILPLNPAGLEAVSADSSFNTAVSFVTNTNWQGYAGETTMSYLTQALGLTVQNFVSAAAGMAVLAALARAFVRREVQSIGNFWSDLVRTTLYVLLPLSLVLALFLVSQGVVQTLSGPAHATLTDPAQGADGAAIAEQAIPLGPAASQVAIKQLGTNGGGFFNTNSAHPLENPTPLSNFFEMLAILILPGALCFTFGSMVGRPRAGGALYLAMLVIFVPLLLLTTQQERSGPTLLHSLSAQVEFAGDGHPGGNMEGKEVRFGIANSALWAIATTAASNGSVNAMHDSFTPLGGLAPLWMIQLGEVVFGGVGSGLYGLLLFALVAVFVGGLMVGRTPEYLGKKIEAFEMKMASIGILVPCAFVLLGTAVAVAVAVGRAGIWNPGAHGFSEVLYALSSASNNNGSAFAGLGANTPFYNTLLGLAMLFGRFWIAIPVLAIAGSLAGKKIVPPGTGTLPDSGPLFISLVVGSVLLVGALTFLPALALGPIVEHLDLLR